MHHSDYRGLPFATRNTDATRRFRFCSKRSPVQQSDWAFRVARKFALRIELVPEPLWGLNLRSNEVGLGPYRWLALSRTVRAELGRCSICASNNRLYFHKDTAITEK